MLLFFQFISLAFMLGTFSGVSNPHAQVILMTKSKLNA